MAHPVKVDFVVAGAQKSGTKALRHYLAAHPDVGLSKREEPHYFDMEIDRDESGDYSGYHAEFDDAALAKCTGDFTPVYLYRRDCPAKMRAYNPGFRVIVVLRNPIERAYSQWAMERDKGHVPGGFLREILREPLHYLRHGQHPVHSLVARGFYARQLKRLYAAFPPEQVLVLRNEALSEDHAGTLRQVYRFLGLRDVPVPAPERVHSREYASMPWLARWVLRRVFARDIRRLERMLGWDLRDWR
ncbi:sulfotransferase family protein [Marimonas arenosa]|uniref:Sulfotransferase domain-containing protein n=1 Tax=Marimonas arenosa TaxID=1795305 RepID=A0AAE4B5E5_9RHOB|nr:sulfotransferase [Marimonas arenosa]MDQ2090259.1 sulfotransferase domain-containing protein [Marimonas arenosa]